MMLTNPGVDVVSSSEVAVSKDARAEIADDSDVDTSEIAGTALEMRMPAAETASDAEGVASETRMPTLDAEGVASETRMPTLDADGVASETRMPTLDADGVALETRMPTLDAAVASTVAAGMLMTTVLSTLEVFVC